jgi:phosphatidylserine/phosphatidylglycerophosphate/cardiolipin synthase-like enzyme
VIELHTLTDGDQTAGAIAAVVADFLKGATKAIDIALYDFALSDATAAVVVGAIREATARGVAVRLLYNVDHAMPIPVPPPPQTNSALVAALGVPVKPISGIPDLMHHKYVVRDGTHVMTGSANWTEDSWTREENVIAVVDSSDVAAAYTKDFEQLWSTERVDGSGAFDTNETVVDGARVTPLFCPGRARRLANRISGAIGRAETRVRVCSPVITAGPILGTLAEVAANNKVDLSGVFDQTQMDEVIGQWKAEDRARWKIPAFESVVSSAPFGGKRSTPWGTGTVHDFMHAKVTVADDVVFLGSYNLSHAGQRNAENMLEIHDGELADKLARFIDALRARYPR